ncbi:type II toxin-antitoxin system VapC family toxin [Pontibacter qinzhouensis]|uniref:Type II toxin-antitoxin system VapC family toxin n=1 Tax=Pontibacter qinzhouensis TaxID=2603253 RepID=A0A5C8K9P0_9BACT|nr:type II toxin-antitoxin system VapC family toxin [Pontibacter qinzhouensis]TXK49234.1 type II toxin-antitoxin system VapC family toxin [Pontibacter qinzhouensis]
MPTSFLLDTHALIWFLNGDKQLSKTARTAIEEESNDKYISVASLWEMAIKISLRKLELAAFSDLANMIAENGFEILPITFEHALKVAKLDFIHGDPFDRILIAQCIVDHLAIISKDCNIAKYPIEVLW